MLTSAPPRSTWVLLAIFAVALFLATLINLGMTFDVFVTPPNLSGDLDLPTRVIQSHPYQEAIWPFDAATNLLYLVAFGSLALVSRSLRDLGGSHPLANLLGTSALVSGVVGAVGSLIYIGGTKVIIDQQYCDCGFKTEEAISQFWAINILQGGTTWLAFGTIAFGALAVAVSASVVGAVMSSSFRGVAGAAVVALLFGLALDIVGQGQVGDVVLALATGILLPAWALMIGMAIRRPAPAPTITEATSGAV
jgi:hypothetical protein